MLPALLTRPRAPGAPDAAILPTVAMSQRLAYLDNLKILLVVGVIALHAAITYGFDGSWYLQSYDEMGSAVIDLLTVVLGTGWLFGLGLFFLIAGRLSGPSLDHKGPGRFAVERLIRLGVPIIAYALLLSPFLEYVDHRWNEDGTEALWPFIADQVWSFAPGPTWFLEALLVLSLAYALWRALTPRREPPPRTPLHGWQVTVAALAIAASSFAVRLVFPLGSEQLHLQLAAFPQYVILFAFGVAAGRRGWLETLTPQLRRRCGLAGAVAALTLPALLLAGGFFEGEVAEEPFLGGLRWQATLIPLAEGVIATCVSLWAIGLFSRRFDHLSAAARWMAPAAYGAFILHPPVLVVLALAVQPLAIGAELKFIVVLAAGVAASFALAALLGRVTPIARVIGSPLRASAGG